jgi:putative ABC transport system permease protein
MLGIIIGVAAVIALLSVGNGFSDFVSGQINSVGTNLIYVLTDSENSDGYPALSMDDLAALSDQSRVPAITALSAQSSGTLEVVYKGVSEFTNVNGVTANYFAINNRTDMLYGGLLTNQDLETEARVVVLGIDLADELFQDEFPVGKNIRIQGVSYEVVGVLAEQDAGFGGQNPNDEVLMPLTTAQARLFTSRTRSGKRAVNVIIAQGRDEGSSDVALQQIADVLREEHGIAYASDDDFTLTSQEDLLSTFGAITSTLTLFLGSIAGISLLVGGIGIMNIMLVSVTERTREIGIRKALGALKRDILTQFMIESLFLSLVGGAIGILLGWAIATVAGNALDVNTVMDANTVSLAVGFSVGVGLIFGIYPAWRAASLNPIEALRYE